MMSGCQIGGSRSEQLGYDGTTPTRTLWSSQRKNYRELAVVKLPREKKRKEKTPRSQIQCCVSGRVKIHHIGFSQDFDKWRDPLDIVPLYEGSEVDDLKSPVLLPFSLYFELCNAIKKALNSGRKESPHVRIKMSFDKLQFTGGLKACSSSSRTYYGTERYKITDYNGLGCLLGKNWHVYGLNTNGDFCYIILNTLEFISIGGSH